METTLATMRAGVKRRRSAANTSQFVLNGSTRIRKNAEALGLPKTEHLTRNKISAHFFGTSLRSPRNTAGDVATSKPFPGFIQNSTITQHRCGKRRRRSESNSTALWRLAVALACVTSSSLCAPVHSGAAVATVTGINSAMEATSQSTRLCAPADNARAYVTTLGEARGLVLGPRVLAQSLRSAGAKGDIIVLVPLDRATGPNVDSLRRDGLTVHIVPRGLQTAGGEIASEDLMTKIFLWSLTSYDRVVYLDPRSLIQKNTDALFACEGFCAAGAVPTPASSGGAATEPILPTWQPSTSVMVIEPSIEVHQAMLEELTQTTASSAGAAGSGGSPLEAQAFLSAFLEAGDHCTPFEDLENDHSSVLSGGTSRKFPKVIGDADADGFGAEIDGSLEEALQPVLLLNWAHMPRCVAGRKRTPQEVCHRLPYSYAAPSTDFNGRDDWTYGREPCATCDQASEPHIVHFADDDSPWKRLAYLHKPLFWRWNKFREQLDQPYGSFFAPWLLFFIPCVVLAFARVYYKTTGLPSSTESNRSRGTGPEESPQRHRTGSGWLAVLPDSGMPGSHDGGAVGVTLARGSSTGGIFGGVGRGKAGGESAAHRPCPQFLRTGVLCYLLTAGVALFGLIWFRSTRALAREVIDARWHPLISIAVYNAWLCCALVLGLYLMDYVYYLFVTRARTLLRDALAVAVFVWTVSRLHARKGTAWAVAIGLGVMALGFVHGGRPDACRRLSERVHFRCITASCLLGALASLAVCYSAATSHVVASHRVQVGASHLQMIFTALVYASVVGGHRLRAGMDEVGRALDRTARSTAASYASLDTLAAVTGTSPVVDETTRTGETESKSRGGPIDERSEAENGDERKWYSIVWTLVVSVSAWVKGIIWQRRVVAGCVGLLVLWPLSSSFQSTTPGRRLEKYGQSCLSNEAGFLEAGGKRLSKVCGAEQALRPVKTGAYFEAFRQDKVCLEVAGGGFLTLSRVHVSEACTPENQFVFQHVAPPSTKKGGPGSRGALSAAPAAGTRDAGKYCVYNPTSGFYLSAQSGPRASCGEHELWYVKPAPAAPGLSRSKQSKKRDSLSTIFMLLHPDFLSRGPLRTLYGYLLAATLLLLSRAFFSKFASAKGEAVAVRCTNAAGMESSTSADHRHRRLGSRRNSWTRKSRARNSFDNDAGHLGDAGYAGDAETGRAGHGHGMGRSKSFGKSARVPSDGALGNDDGEEHIPCGPNLVVARSFSGEKALGGEGRLSRTRSAATAEGIGLSSGGAPVAHAKGAWVNRVRQVSSVLCLACDATLLAGLSCLVPTHFAQALSVLTHDHNSAIQQGLGMDALASEHVGSTMDASTRGLEEDAIVIHDGGAGAFGAMFGQGDLGIDAGGNRDALTVPTCDGTAWWVLAALVRWHLFFVLVAFCHLHGAAQAATAVTHNGRDRRTGKRIVNDRVSFWGLRAGERVAMRLRTALGVLAILCVAATASGAGFGTGSKSAVLLGLHAHPAWSKCAPAAGLDGSWGGVSPLLVFAVLAAGAGVYLRAGATRAVRITAVVSLIAAGTMITAAVGRAYLVLAVVAFGMDWAAWGIAGLLSCVCYQKPRLLKYGRDSSGSAGSFEADESNAGSTRRTHAIRRKVVGAARRGLAEVSVMGSRIKHGAMGGGNSTGVAHRRSSSRALGIVV